MSSLLDALFLDPAPFNIFVAARTDQQGGSGTLNDPYDGSTQSRFDTVMRNLPASVPVHVYLGPGTFQTQGYYDGAASDYGFQPKAGMKIIGSGIDVTTLQLVNNLAANYHYFAIGHALANNLDFCEVSDLTIDCNLQNQANTVACGAIRLMGNHVRIRRVKAKKWGNKLTNNLGFVLAVVTAEPATGASLVDVGIEDCIVVEPTNTTTNEVLILHAGGKDYDATQNLEAYGTGAFIRNCFVDCDAGGQLGDGTDYRAKLRGLSISSCKDGLVEGNEIHNTWHGGPYLTKWSARDIVVRNNSHKNVVFGTYLNLPAPATGISITQFSLPDPSPSTMVEATTQSNHPLATGDRVKISNATDSLLNGVFIATVTASNKFRYNAASRPNPAGTGTMQKVLGVENLLVEANVVELAPFKTGSNIPIAIRLNADSGAAQALAYVYGDVIIRENKVQYLDGQFDSAFFGYPLNVKGARNLIVRQNVIESAPALPFQNSMCGSVKYFNDNTPAGVLVQGVNADQSNKKYDELQTEAEDALVLALLEH